ncbi:hypothetical protein ACF0H5_015954 [Mactra antiquata]
MGLDKQLFQVNIRGLGGLSLHQRRLHSYDVQLKNNDIVLLDIGSNDLCNPDCSPEQFALDLMKYASYLIIGLNVKKVVLLQTLHRSKVPFNGYNEHVVRANTAIQNLVDTSSLGIFYWRHRVNILCGRLRTDRCKMPPKRKAAENSGSNKKSKKCCDAINTNDIVNAVIIALEQRGVIPNNNGEEQSVTVPNIREEPSVTDAIQQNLMPAVLELEWEEHNIIHGEASDNNQNQHYSGINPVSLHSNNLPLGALVSDKIKKNIWNNEYVELSVLLDKKNNQDEMTLKFSANGQNIKVGTKQKTVNLSIGKWLSAFTIYMDIFIVKYPEDASGMLSFINLVRDLETVHKGGSF